MFRNLPLALFLFSSTFIAAEVRQWKSADGARSFQGEFIERNGDEITINRSSGGEITFPIDKLHADDRKWIEENFPLKSEEPDATGVFGDLKFGDTHEAIYQKLEKSSLVESLPEVSMFGSMGLTDHLRTKQQLGGLDCFITFGWADDGTLNEINLKTDGLPASQYPTRLKQAWTECTQLISTLHGNPVQAADFPLSSDIPPEMAAGTHLWNLEGGGSAMVGLLRKEGGFGILIRFTQDSMIPAKPSPE